MKGERKGLPQKHSLSMLHVLRERNIDIVEMQMAVYNRAIKAYDEFRGETDKASSGASYLSAANQAIATLARYSYPTMTAIKVESLDQVIADKVIDAAVIREKILNDPILNKAVAASKPTASEALPLLDGKPLEVNK